ncbi:MAG TPA: hypothetical protein DEP35_13835 [Deltaproteobacteria bacterium]|nr:hypothetical protein [Deltaproteobacteria bacterium]
MPLRVQLESPDDSLSMRPFRGAPYEPLHCEDVADDELFCLSVPLVKPGMDPVFLRSGSAR